MQTLTRTKTKEVELYDETIGYDDDIPVRLPKGLTEQEIHQASMLYNLFNELWGVCIVVGDPGSGKDLFSNYITYRIKRYFPYKRILRDEKPRELFGPYAGLFNEQVLAEDLAKMRDVAKGVAITKVDEVMEKHADSWVTDKGEVLLKNSVLYLTEYWRYCYNREPHNPMNKTLGGIHKMKRHLDCLVIGTVQLPTELDKKTCLPWVDWRVTCTKSQSNKTGFTYFIERVKYDRRIDLLCSISKPFPLSIDAGKPRTYMGDGKIIVRKPKYTPDNEEERIVLHVLNSGATNYEEVVDVLETDGDMSEYEVLATIKELKFNKRKRVIDYPCDFGLYNSKSAPNLKTSMKVAD